MLYQKSGKRLSCDFAIVIKEWETTSSHHYVPRNHFLCGNYGNMLITLKTRHVYDLMNAPKFTAGTPMAIICSTVQNVPRSYSSNSDRDGKLLRLQGYDQRSFVKSIGGEESPSTSDCITLHDQYGPDLSCQERPMNVDVHSIHAFFIPSPQERLMNVNVHYFSLALPCIR